MAPAQTGLRSGLLFEPLRVSLRARGAPTWRASSVHESAALERRGLSQTDRFGNVRRAAKAPRSMFPPVMTTTRQPSATGGTRQVRGQIQQHRTGQQPGGHAPQGPTASAIWSFVTVTISPTNSSIWLKVSSLNDCVRKPSAMVRNVRSEGQDGTRPAASDSLASAADSGSTPIIRTSALAAFTAAATGGMAHRLPRRISPRFLGRGQPNARRRSTELPPPARANKSRGTIQTCLDALDQVALVVEVR